MTYEGSKEKGGVSVVMMTYNTERKWNEFWKH